MSPSAVTNSSGTKTIEDLLGAEEIVPRTWYWVVRPEQLSINTEVFTEHEPLYTKKRFLVVDIVDYLSQERRSVPWVAFMFGKHTLPEGSEVFLLSHQVGLRHTLESAAPPASLARALHSEPVKAGIQAYKITEQGATKLDFQALPFLRHYWVVNTIMQRNGSLKREIFRNETAARTYTIYMYYPNGRLRETIHIGTGSKDMQPPKYNHLYPYAITTTQYEYKDTPERKDAYEGKDKPKWKRTNESFHDVNHRWWLPNILHD